MAVSFPLPINVVKREYETPNLRIRSGMFDFGGSSACSFFAADSASLRHAGSGPGSLSAFRVALVCADCFAALSCAVNRQFPLPGCSGSSLNGLIPSIFSILASRATIPD